MQDVINKFTVVPLLNQVPLHEDVLGKWRHSSMHWSSTLHGGEWSASRPDRRFTSRDRVSVTHLIWGWVGLRAYLDAVAEPGIEPQSFGP